MYGGETKLKITMAVCEPKIEIGEGVDRVI